MRRAFRVCISAWSCSIAIGVDIDVGFVVSAGGCGCAGIGVSMYATTAAGIYHGARIYAGIA